MSQVRKLDLSSSFTLPRGSNIFFAEITGGGVDRGDSNGRRLKGLSKMGELSLELERIFVLPGRALMRLSDAA